jgi:hypothetical protein
MQLRNLFPFIYFGLLFLNSCSAEDVPDNPDNPEQEYSEGIFVLNEGVWGEGNSSISFIEPATENTKHDIYKNANNGAALGDTGQSIGFYEEYAFVVMNASNTIEVVDRNTFLSVATIDTDLQSPRYIAFSEGKAFVSNWGVGTDPNDDFITVINVEDFSVEKTIAVGEGPERMVSGAGKVYVAHTGGFNVNDKITVIDAVKRDVETTITVAQLPNSLLLQGGDLWVLSGGNPGYTSGETSGVLSKIDLSTNEVVREISFSNVSDHPANLDFVNEQFYYTLGKEVYAFNRSSEAFPTAPLFEMAEVEFLYGFEVAGASIFAASANYDFTGNGKLLEYDLSGNILNSFETGVNPNGIYGNK